MAKFSGEWRVDIARSSLPRKAVAGVNFSHTDRTSPVKELSQACERELYAHGQHDEPHKACRHVVQ